MTLLEKAKAVPTKISKCKDGEVDLAIAWMKGQITYTQCFKALDSKNGSAAYVRLAIGLKKAYEQGKIKIP